LRDCTCQSIVCTPNSTSETCDDEAAARGFLDSPLYRDISEDRYAGAETTAVLVQGLDAPKG
jgi:hypothetical protein